MPLHLDGSSNLDSFEGDIELSSLKKKALPSDDKVLRVSPRSPAAATTAEPLFWAKFKANSSFNCSSVYSGSPLDLGMLSEYCSFDDGYVVFSPDESDRMWGPSRNGRHAIPDIFFKYGFRLPMHPFYFFVLEAFGYG